MPSRFVRLSTAALLLAVTAAAGRAQPAAKPGAKGAGGWTWLFNGTSTDAWRGYQMKTMPAGWSIKDGTLTKSGSVEDLISKDEWGNFELEFEWKLGKGGNSGVFYRATEEYPKVYWSATEYQLLDDAGHPDGKNPLTSAAAAYALYAPPRGVVKPADQWNSSRIVVRGTHAEHWLNGKKVVEYEYGSPDWTAKVKASKFGEWANYGKAAKGHVAIQGDHDGQLALRNIRIRAISPKEPK
ncbi:MAG: DUF1080 domain-containing protein [Gemmatimonadetes bacterium]|nr:DUF1080 domain-containing protein [Gemmatimonadota bacterium]